MTNIFEDKTECFIVIYLHLKKSIRVQRNYKEHRQLCYNYGCKAMFNFFDMTL